MKYLDPKFTVTAPGTDAYRDNWDRIFGPKNAQVCEHEEERVGVPCPDGRLGCAVFHFKRVCAKCKVELTAGNIFEVTP